MDKWSWREGFFFAFAGKLLSEKDEAVSYEMSVSEKFGSQVLKPLYRIIEFVSKSIKQPLAICLFTVLAALIAALVFYNIPAIIILGKLIPVQLIRALLFIYMEVNIFAMGCRAFGRFNNKGLVALWKQGHLVAVFPGDYRSGNKTRND